MAKVTPIFMSKGGSMDKISPAKRLNNNKRGYLIINANQGKHKIALIRDVKNEYDTLANLSSEILKNSQI